MIFMCAGSVLFVAGSGSFQTLDAKSSLLISVICQLITGLGVGICVQMPLSAVQQTADEEDKQMACK
jgi:glucose-6-phosphate-specific signal transduction histidine kinase